MSLFKPTGTTAAVRLAVAVMAALVLAACQRVRPEADADAVRFDTVAVDTLFRLQPDQAHPVAHVQIRLLRPVEAAAEASLPAIQTFVVSMVRQGAFAGRAGTHVECVPQLYADDYLALYAIDASEALSNYDEAEGPGSWLDYEELCHGEPLYNCHGLLSYQVLTYSFTGGAHGMNTACYGVFDVRTLSPLTMADLFLPDVQDLLADLVRQKLMADYECSDLEKLNDYFFDPAHIEVTENFYVSDAGVTWGYDPYEIAPYSTGAVVVTVSWDDLKDLLLPDTPVRRIL